MPEDALARMVRLDWLCDFYGALLSERQRRCVELYVHEGLSLAEVSARIGMSRQAVSEALRRAQAQCEEYERCLQLGAQHVRRVRLLYALRELGGDDVVRAVDALLAHEGVVKGDRNGAV
ncbi:MAG: DNA-binding protein [Paenibacillaceae bacterium]|nr:DNA-binding protein [Paenibacillaceae bacterium]